ATQHASEPILGHRELKEGEQVTMVAQPPHRRPDTELDAPERIGLVGDGLLLAPAQLLLGLAEDLAEELLFRREVPVEDALAHTQPGDDLGDRGRVVTVLGETADGVLHELTTPLPTPLGETTVHRLRTLGTLDRLVREPLPGPAQRRVDGGRW